MTLIPKSGMVLVEPFPAKLSGGLVQLADVYDTPETSGVVVGLAESFACPECGCQKAPELSVGDIVLFPASAGNLFELENVRYVLMAESDVLAVIGNNVEAEVL